MSPATIIIQATADGVRLALSPTGTIKASGDGVAVNRWLPVIRDSKAEIIEALKVGAGGTATAFHVGPIHYVDRDLPAAICSPEVNHADILEMYPHAVAAKYPNWFPPKSQYPMCVGAVAAEPLTPSIGQTAAPITAEEEAAIRAWLALIEETDPATIAEVIDKCQKDSNTRGYFTGRAAAELPKPAPFPDDRRTCGQCLNLRGRVCWIARPGGLVSANEGYRPAPEILQRCAGYLPGTGDPDQRSGRERWPGL